MEITVNDLKGLNLGGLKREEVVVLQDSLADALVGMNISVEELKYAITMGEEVDMTHFYKLKYAANYYKIFGQRLARRLGECNREIKNFNCVFFNVAKELLGDEMFDNLKSVANTRICG